MLVKQSARVASELVGWVFLTGLRNATEQVLAKAAKLLEIRDKEDTLELLIQALEVDLPGTGSVGCR
jgi:ribosomal protein S7